MIMSLYKICLYTCIIQTIWQNTFTTVLKKGNFNYVKPGLVKPKTRVAFLYT